MPADPAAIERSKLEIKSILERVRGAIRMRVHPRDQTQLLDAVDRIQETCINAIDTNAVTTNLQRGRDDTRKVLEGVRADLGGAEEDMPIWVGRGGVQSTMLRAAQRADLIVLGRRGSGVVACEPRSAHRLQEHGSG